MTSQRERTAQAWTRTCLSLLGMVLWGFHLEVREGGAAILLAVLVLVAGTTFAFVGQQRTVALRAEAEPAPLPPVTVLAMAAAVVVIDAAAAALVFSL